MEATTPRSVRTITQHQSEHRTVTRRVEKIANALARGTSLTNCRTEAMGLRRLLRNREVPDHLVEPVEWVLARYDEQGGPV